MSPQATHILCRHATSSRLSVPQRWSVVLICGGIDIGNTPVRSHVTVGGWGPAHLGWGTIVRSGPFDVTGREGRPGEGEALQTSSITNFMKSKMQLLCHMGPAVRTRGNWPFPKQF